MEKREESVVIRAAVPEDLPVLLAFEQGVIEAERPMDVTLRKGALHYYDLETLIQDPESRVVVAELGGQVVASGFGLVKEARHYLDHDRYAYLGFMYTDPGSRGMGINARIVEDLKGWALERGLKEIRLTVYADNFPAIRAYEKVGFKKHMMEMRLE